MKKTVLDLIQEYATLNEAKTLARGALAPAQEARWAELKQFYELVMDQEGLAPQPLARFTAAEIREKVRARSRLRVHTQLETVIISGQDYYPALVSNLSCGGALVHCAQRFEPGQRLTLQLANFSRGREVFPTETTVVWCSDSDRRDASLAYRVGVRFDELGPDESRSLDSFVVDSLETKLLSLRRDVLDPEFVHREHLAI